MFKRDTLKIVLDDEHILFGGTAPSRVVRGHVLLSINSTVKIKSVDLSFEGTVVIRGKENGSIHFQNTLLSRGWQFLGLSGEPRLFSTGIYKYHFELLLNTSLPDSVFTKHGSIQYLFYARANRTGFRRTLNDTKQIYIQHPMPIETEQALIKTGELESKLRFYVLAPTSRYKLGDEIPVRIGTKPLLDDIRITKITLALYEGTKYRTPNGWSSTYSHQITGISSPWPTSSSELLEQTLRLYIPNTLSCIQIDCCSIFYQIKHTLDIIINLIDEARNRKAIVIRVPIHLASCFTDYDNELPSYEGVLTAPPEYATAELCPPYSSRA
ncbi:hypothetical protein K7432_000325 [Basidiobolus ranarum]|uniref:Arrestin-like N-terminal domain-containing protein n=1 Tax=Basidiobolus ranarum TaxID=34480 RepID=A0ABR2WBC2_9FUNG